MSIPLLRCCVEMACDEKVSLDDVQDGFDSLVLALFNSIRGYTPSSPEPSTGTASSSNPEIIQNLTNEYQKTMRCIENLKGNRRAAEEQEQEIESLQVDIATMKKSLFHLENNLNELNERCDQELREILTDELLTRSCDAKTV